MLVKLGRIVSHRPATASLAALPKAILRPRLCSCDVYPVVETSFSQANAAHADMIVTLGAAEGNTTVVTAFRRSAFVAAVAASVSRFRC